MYKAFLTICFVIVSAAGVNAQQIDSLNKKSARDKATDKQIRERLDSARANPIVPRVKERIYHPDSNHNPHLAVMRSLMVPGWGQVYNRQIWKVPLVYTGLVLFGYYYFSNQHEYSMNLKVAQDRQKAIAPAIGDPEYELYHEYQDYNVSSAAINDAVTTYKRYKELDIFGFIGMWGIQMIDAYIDAKFQHSYTMDNNLSFKVSPIIIDPKLYAANFNGSYIPGLKVTFTLR